MISDNTAGIITKRPPNIAIVKIKGNLLDNFLKDRKKGYNIDNVP
jgi:hypothetical protein